MYGVDDVRGVVEESNRKQEATVLNYGKILHKQEKNGMCIDVVNTAKSRCVRGVGSPEGKGVVK